MDNIQQNLIPDNLRITDLVAKTACVTLKNTIRVALALAAVSKLYGTDALAQVIDTYDTSRPSPDNVAACEQASLLLREGDMAGRTAIDSLLRELSEIH